MGLADWGDDELFNKKMDKQTSEEAIKKEIIDWIESNTLDRIYKNKFEFDFNISPITINYEGDIRYASTITSLTNGIFQWGKVNKIFCCHCDKLDLNVPEKKLITENKLITECSLCNVSTFYHFENTLHTEISDKYNCATHGFVEKVQEIHKQKVIPSLLNIKDEILSWKSVPLSIGCIPIHFGRQEGKKYLGLYRRNNDGTREIILFEDAIKSEAKRDNDYLKNLIWKVIIHEYAHAIMDTLQDDKIETQDPKLYKYREESLANAFALKVLEMSIENTEFDKIKGFVNKQDEEYRHGLVLYEREDLLKMMEFWREMKIEGNNRFK